MNIAEFSIRKNVITLVFIVLMLAGGILSYGNLSRLEDPEFTIKEAIVLTPYPGASSHEVEEEVSNVLEKAVQELGQLDYVRSQSKRGFSTLKVIIKDQYDKVSLPQVWDELRRKINDAQIKLPPGAGPSIVNDDFGDVYGIFLTLSGEGYSYKELKDTAEFLRKELLLAQDVKKIVFYGIQPEVVYVEISRSRMSEIGITYDQIYSALRAKNLVADAGWLKLGPEFIPINPTGEFTSEQQFGDLLISGEGSDRLIFLKDVATIKRDYKDPPDNIIRNNGKPAIGIGISTLSGGNVVNMGNAIEKRLQELLPQIPIGMELGVIALQSKAVAEAISGFVKNLIAAVVIVVVVLLLFMGLRSGLIIGFILFLTICGSFIFMDMWQVTLERISLGALIIALGMLVDNAIVVTDGIKVKMEKGTPALKAAMEVVGQTATPLFAATVVAVMAFAAIGLSDDSTGEFCRSLFQVILISLMLSWVTAVTVTPLICKMFLLPKKAKTPSTDKPSKDPYGGKFYQLYRNLLCTCIRLRGLTMAIVIGLFCLALYGFRYVDNSFFPTSTRAQFFIDFWLPEGTHINTVSEKLKKAEAYLIAQEEVTDVATEIGGGQLRFLLTYTPESASWSFGQIIVSVNDYKSIDSILPKVQEELTDLLPNVVVNCRKFLLGPGDGGKIQIRITGPDYTEVRKLAKKAKAVLYQDGGAIGIRDDWREKVKVIRPQMSEAQARRTGITRPDLAKTLQESFIGTKTGIYREVDDLINIVSRPPAIERLDADNLNQLDIWSPAAEKMIPIRQVVSEFKTEYEDANIWRRNRVPTLTIHADPKEGLASNLLARIKPKVEQAVQVDVAQVLGKTFGPNEDPFGNFDDKTLPIVYKNKMPLIGKPGYYLGWDGEAEDSAKAQAALAGSIPMFVVLMVLIVICLFNAFRQPLIIWLCVPLALIGVSAGLLLTNQPFGFMSLLGLLSLSGMLIKNAIVLIDQIDLEIREGKDPLQAIMDSGVGRLRPVAMAALTTMLGMLPLFTDAFFVAMAVTIVFGLGFATVLTLVVVPTLYAIFFKVPFKKLERYNQT